MPGLIMERYRATGETAKVDLELQVDEGAGAFRGQFVHAVSLFDADTVRRMVRHFEWIMDRRRRERKRTRVPDRGPGRDRVRSPRGRTRACGTGVVAGDTSLSYREVDIRANRLAHRLRRLGAGPDSLVGVCLEPGPDLIPTLLGMP
ncbi:AMP-binding protein [Embleya sp. NPDC020886]|uniref:AMP-binding protein n=1 Tax=Embleya sp. NPDC020886 TaxID=3363980 RepID=UPI0037AE70E4